MRLSKPWQHPDWQIVEIHAQLRKDRLRVAALIDGILFQAAEPYDAPWPKDPLVTGHINAAPSRSHISRFFLKTIGFGVYAFQQPFDILGLPRKGDERHQPR